VEGLLTQVSEQLQKKAYRPGPVRRVYIPKANGGERPLGIPNIIDRVVQMASKLILEPIFEADFEPQAAQALAIKSGARYSAALSPVPVDTIAVRCPLPKAMPWAPANGSRAVVC
jgi:hypothetical protein